MKNIAAFSPNLTKLLPLIICSDQLHAKWLNTLSFLENCGARKIAKCEHPTKVKQEMLKHAAEEFRHALILKQQITKISTFPLETYALNHLLGSRKTLCYLQSLDILTSRLLKRELGLEKSSLKQAAYCLVTYAIELRASELYPLYQQALKLHGSKVSVKSIIFEEEEHLKEMEEEIEKLRLPSWVKEKIYLFEMHLCVEWLNVIQQDLNSG
jgi:hypothetical protein